MSDFELRNYLMPTSDSFWKWGERGEVVSWADGPTIAFRRELIGVLWRLTPHGLPPFGAVLLLMSATRESWRDDGAEAGLQSGLLAHGWKLLPRPAPLQNMILRDVLRGLGLVSTLPVELRIGQAAREELADLVFERAMPRTPRDLAARIVEQLEAGLLDEWLEPASDDRDPVQSFAEDLRALRGGLSQLDVERLRLRMRTGLDAEPASVPETIPVELPPCEQVRVLLQSLNDDAELSGLARLTRRLLAAVTLPRQVSDAEDLPLGGVSDITNRGPLDRLLLSELAYDDLTLAVRVAENEALYLRRESPPRTPPRTRALLLDSGVRMWGLPRVFGVSVALALSATADRHTASLAWRATGDDIESLDLTTRDGLLSHLEALTPDQHPGAALSAFLEASAGADEVDRVLITTEDTLTDPEFQRALSDAAPWPIYVASVTRDGQMRLQRLNNRGSKLLREATLDLSDLTKPGHRAPAAPSRLNPADLPAIFHVQPFPLWMPYQFDSRRMWPLRESGVLTATHDRRLLLCEYRQKGHVAHGARQLADDLPGEHLWWCQEWAAKHIIAVVGHKQLARLSLVVAHLPEQNISVTRLDLPESVIHGVARHIRSLFVVLNDRVEVFDLWDGTRQGSMSLPPGLKYRGQRFFRGDNGEWLAMSFDGSSVALELIPNLQAENFPTMAHVFEADEIEGPIGITVLGDLLFSGAHELIQLTPRELPLRWPDNVGSTFGRFARNGRRFVVPNAEVKEYCDPCRGVTITANSSPLGLPSAKVITLARGAAPNFLEPSFSNLGAGRSLRVHLREIGVTSTGTMYLAKRNDEWETGRDATSGPCPGLELVLNRQADTIRLVFRNDLIVVSCLRFTDKDEWRVGGVRLSVAEWPDGSQAVLDSRGLLHLVSSDKNVAELTLVLDEKNVSMWCSNGKTAGDEYYFAARPTLTPRQAYENYLKRFIEKLPR